MIGQTDREPLKRDLHLTFDIYYLTYIGLKSARFLATVVPPSLPNIFSLFFVNGRPD